jgi:hypothetical protein
LLKLEPVTLAKKREKDGGSVKGPRAKRSARMVGGIDSIRASTSHSVVRGIVESQESRGALAEKLKCPEVRGAARACVDDDVGCMALGRGCWGETAAPCGRYASAV